MQSVSWLDLAGDLGDHEAAYPGGCGLCEGWIRASVKNAAIGRFLRLLISKLGWEVMCVLELRDWWIGVKKYEMSLVILMSDEKNHYWMIAIPLNFKLD